MSDAQPREPDASLGDLLSRLSAQLSQLVRQEVTLAKTEIAEDLHRAQRLGVMFAGAAGIGVVAALLLAFAAAWGLAELMAPGLAFLIVGVVLGAVAAVLFLRAKRAAQDFNPAPEHTVETLKEDAQWLKERRT